MSEKESKDAASGAEGLDLSSLVEGGLTPDWVRKDPAKQQFNDREFRDSGSRGGRRDSGDRTQRRRDRDDVRRRSRRPRDADGPRKRRRPQDGAAPRDGGAPAGTGAPAAAPTGDARRPAPAAGHWQADRRGGGHGYDRGRPQHANVAVDIRFLPDQKRLSAVIHRIHTSHKAWSLRDVAALFLDHPDSVQVKFESKPDETRQDLFQCKLCGMVGLNSEDLIEHFREVHVEDFYASRTEKVDPPTGNFVCVYRCPMSGILLGPPNYHGTKARIEAVRRERFSQMPPDVYSSRIECIHEEELVEEWRASNCEHVVYTRKPPKSKGRKQKKKRSDAPEATATAERAEPTDQPEVAETSAQEQAPAEVAADTAVDAPEERKLTRAEAESELLREIAPRHVVQGHRAICRLSVAQKIGNSDLAYAFRGAWNRERRFPSSLFFALRGAFRHRHLHVFKAGEDRGIDFVVAHKPSRADPEHMVDELKSVLAFIETHPACTVAEMFEGVGVSPDPSSADAVHLLSHLQWLVEKGHIIEYYNGVLALPSSRPAFRHLTEAEQKAADEAKRPPAAATADPSADPSADSQEDG